jgi:hypothetical protein
MRAVLIGLMAALLSVPALAQVPSVIGVHLTSAHVGGKEPGGSRGWNNRNPGLYARWSNGLTIGAFRNSLYRQSTYLGWTLSDKVDHFSVTLGVVSGYDRLTDGVGDHQEFRCDKGNGCRMVQLKDVILPLVVPSVRIGLTDKVSARLSALVTPRQPPAMHLSLEWRI